jgi:hypothetical protein
MGRNNSRGNPGLRSRPANSGYVRNIEPPTEQRARPEQRPQPRRQRAHERGKPAPRLRTQQGRGPEEVTRLLVQPEVIDLRAATERFDGMTFEVLLRAVERKVLTPASIEPRTGKILFPVGELADLAKTIKENSNS